MFACNARGKEESREATPYIHNMTLAYTANTRSRDFDLQGYGSISGLLKLTVESSSKASELFTDSLFHRFSHTGANQGTRRETAQASSLDQNNCQKSQESLPRLWFQRQNAAALFPPAPSIMRHHIASNVGNPHQVTHTDLDFANVVITRRVPPHAARELHPCSISHIWWGGRPELKSTRIAYEVCENRIVNSRA